MLPESHTPRPKCMHGYAIILYCGTSFIQASINWTLHLPNLLDSQKLFRYSQVKIINMTSNSSLGSDDVGIPSMKCKRKVVCIEKKLKICCRHEMGQSYTSSSKEYGLRKSTIHDIVQSEDWLTEYAMEIQLNMLQDQKEALLGDPRMMSWIRLFRNGLWECQSLGRF